jgi:hypothetical protein
MGIDDVADSTTATTAVPSGKASKKKIVSFGEAETNGKTVPEVNADHKTKILSKTTVNRKDKATSKKKR